MCCVVAGMHEDGADAAYAAAARAELHCKYAGDDVPKLHCGKMDGIGTAGGWEPKVATT